MGNNDLEYGKNIMSDDIIGLFNDAVEFATDLPVVDVIAKLIKITYSIRDRLFVEKIIAFINGTKNLDETKRKKALCDIEVKMKGRSGEQLLYMIDRMSNKQKVNYLSKLFAARVNNLIDTECFFRLFTALERIPYLDIEKLRRYKSDYYDEYTIDIFHSAGVIRLSEIKNGSNGIKSDRYILSCLGIKLVEILFEEKYESGMANDKYIKISNMLTAEFLDEIDEVKM